MVSCVKRVAKSILGEFRNAPQYQGTSWWNKKVKIYIEIKRKFPKDLNNDGVNFKSYKLAIESKKVT